MERTFGEGDVEMDFLSDPRELSEAIMTLIDGVIAFRLERSVAHPTTCEKTLEKISSPYLRAMGFSHYADLPPYRERTRYEYSRWCKRRDSSRCIPELHLMAVLKYGPFTAPWVQPHWKDGNPLNIRPENVSLEDEKPRQRGAVPGETRSKYGVKAGTATYRKAYYMDPANRQRLRRQTRESAARKRKKDKAIVQRVQTLTQGDPSAAARLDELQRILLGEVPGYTAPAQQDYAGPSQLQYTGPPCPKCGSPTNANGHCSTPDCDWDSVVAAQKDREAFQQSLIEQEREAERQAELLKAQQQQGPEQK